jgi:hypothetical protein
LDITGKMAGHMDELKSMMGGYATKDAGTQARIVALETELAKLKGDQPTMTLPDEIAAALKSAGPQAPPDPSAVQVPNDPSRPLAALAAATAPELYGGAAPRVTGFNGANGWQFAVPQPPQPNTGGN